MSYQVLRVIAVAAVTALVLGFVTMLAFTTGVFRSDLVQPRAVVAAASASVPRQITAVGHGQVNVIPDIATAQLGVRTEGEALKAALEANTIQMAAVIAKLKELGVGEADIQTSNLSIEPRYSRETGSPMPGYQVSNMVVVTIRKLDQAGAILDQALGAGANQVIGFSLGSAEASTAEQAARDKAIADARERAEGMAKASGAKLGQVLNISEQLGMSAPASFAPAGGAPAAAMPIQPGQQAIGAQVQVTFELN